MPAWLASIPPSDWLNSLVNAVDIFVAFVAGAIIGPWINARRAKLESKERLLRTLLNTKLDVGHPDYSASITVIPLEFASSRRVKSAHAKFLAATNRNFNNEMERAAIDIEISNRLDDLISEMASDIGLDITGHEGFKYQSTAYFSRGQLQSDAMAAIIRIADTLERAEKKTQASGEHKPSPDGGFEHELPQEHRLQPSNQSSTS